jgi:hypothetical protein
VRALPGSLFTVALLALRDLRWKRDGIAGHGTNFEQLPTNACCSSMILTRGPASEAPDLRT